MKKTIYIAGPMTGYKDFNFPAFDAAQKYLMSIGFDVVNPVDIARDISYTMEISMEEVHEKYRIYILKTIIDGLFGCDFIYLLDKWNTSYGAVMFFQIAKTIKLNFIFENKDTAEYHKDINK